MSNTLISRSTVVADPPLARFLFSDTRMALVWLIVRIYVGWSFLEAGFHKIQDPGWMESGKSILGFWMSAVKIPAAPAKPAISYDWYRGFLQFLDGVIPNNLASGGIDDGHYVSFRRAGISTRKYPTIEGMRSGPLRQ